MAQLPANRTKLQAAIANQQPSIIASAQANREAMVEAYDTIDQLYNFTTGFVAGGTLQPYPFGVNRNALINPGFSVNQRAKSGTVTLAAGAYGHDRWKAGAAGCTYTFATFENVTTITITAGSLVQVIEGINLYSGTYTLTWTGTAQGKIGAGAYGAAGITGTVVGGTNLSIEFNVGTISNVQFNFGSSAVPFQPRSFAEELAMCRRYFQKSFPYATAPAQASGRIGVFEIMLPHSVVSVSWSGWVELPVTMRITPTITFYNPDSANGLVRNMSKGADMASVTSDRKSESSFNILTTNPASTTGWGVGQDYIGVHYTLDSEI